MKTAGFMQNGIDFAQLMEQYKNNNCYLEITDPEEVALATNLMQHVIDTSRGYQDNFSKTIDGRFQIICNSAMQEAILKTKGFFQRSNAFWALDGSYERGTDFRSTNGKQIEAKVYKNQERMLNAAKKGSKDYTVFHGADYVCVYLIDSFECIDQEPKHWYWLKKIDGEYVVYNDNKLNELTYDCLPKTIPICYCKVRDNKFIIGKNTFCY